MRSKQSTGALRGLHLKCFERMRLQYALCVTIGWQLKYSVRLVFRQLCAPSAGWSCIECDLALDKQNFTFLSHLQIPFPKYQHKPA